MTSKMSLTNIAWPLILATVMVPQLYVAVELDYPGAPAYSELDKYLENHSGTDSETANLELIESLLQELKSDDKSVQIRPEKLIDAAELVVALNRVANENRCDRETNQLVRFNFMGTLSGRNKFDYHSDTDHLEISKLAALVNWLTLKIVVHCERDISTRLNKAIELVPKESYDLLKKYLSEDFMQRYKSNGRVPPFYGIMDTRLEPFGADESRRAPNEMLIDHLFTIAGASRQVIENGNTKSLWPKIDADKFDIILEKHLSGPCRDYLENTRLNVFEIFHWIRTYMSYKLYDPRRLMTAQGSEFKYQVFRYDFCNLYSSSHMSKWLFDKYLKFTREHIILD